MTVLPYVTVSIIGGLGALDAAQARTLGKRVGLILVLLWAVALAAVLLFPLMFPPNQNASFFSTTLLQEREPFDFLNLYIPTNPFYSLANNVVPAVVLFSIVVGVALIGVPDKAPLLDVLAIAGRAVSKATSFVVALTPYRRVRDRRGRRGNAEPRGAGTPAGVSGQLRRHVAAPQPVGAAGPRRRADAGSVSRADRRAPATRS